MTEIRKRPRLKELTSRARNATALDVSGSIFFEKDRGRWAVCWYHPVHKKPYTIRHYKGDYMYHRKYAEKALALIQNRWEQHLRKECQFRIEEFTGRRWTDVIDFYEEWLKEIIRPLKKPSTHNGYKSYLKNWLRPFFEQSPIQLHEIDLHTLNKLLNFINLSGKGKLNVIMALHAMMDYAWRSKRIQEIPPFPKREDYGILDPDFDFLWEDQQMDLIETIPAADRPPLLWLKYHYRRPGEACALLKTDYDVINNAFWIRRTISARQLVDSTKTGKVHYVPCHSKFTSVARELLNKNQESLFLFVNPRSRKKDEGSRYTIEALNNLWKAACKKVGIQIQLYHGTKHSSCTQFICEKGGSDSELQMLTDHSRLDSVKKYRKVNLDRKRELMERGKVISINYSKATPSTK